MVKSPHLIPAGRSPVATSPSQVPVRSQPSRSPVAGRLQLILGFDDGQPIRLQGGTRHLWEGAVRDHHLRTNMGELADARLEHTGNPTKNVEKP